MNSPTPWYYILSPRQGGSHRATIYSADGDVVAVEMTREDASLIVDLANNELE